MYVEILGVSAQEEDVGVVGVLLQEASTLFFPTPLRAGFLLTQRKRGKGQGREDSHLGSILPVAGARWRWQAKASPPGPRPPAGGGGAEP